MKGDTNIGGAALALTVGGAALSAYGQGAAGKAQSSYYNYLSSTANQNAGLAEAEGVAQGRQINNQALFEQRQLTNRVDTTTGAQKAALVNGAGASSRTAGDVISDTMNKGELDQEALNYNTETKARNANISSQMQAFNYKSQAGGYSIAGQNVRAATSMQQRSTLLGGASSVANAMWMADLYGGRNNPLKPTNTPGQVPGLDNDGFGNA